jgi:hypothetical protein
MLFRKKKKKKKVSLTKYMVNCRHKTREFFVCKLLLSIKIIIFMVFH